MKLYALIMAFIVALLVGCAATPTENDYHMFARDQQALDACASANYITSAQWGAVELINEDDFTGKFGNIDPERVALAKSMLPPVASPDQATCISQANAATQVNGEIRQSNQNERQRRIDNAATNAAYSVQPVVPQMKSTYCNQYGTQTVCRTY